MSGANCSSIKAKCIADHEFDHKKGLCGPITLFESNDQLMWYHKYGRVALLNLLMVATIGVVLRYKIAFSLPFVDQKHLLHGHSHFAFAGWVTQALMVLMVQWMGARSSADMFSRYRPLLLANLITAYGMLIAFPLQGYGAVSIGFSTCSIFVSYAFAFRFWKDLDALPEASPVHRWFKAAVLFNALSSLGAFALAYMMATHEVHLNGYLASVYFFLHFQYNGWFFFGCMGLLVSMLYAHGAPVAMLQRVFLCFASACVPAYLLSALWMPIPVWVYVLVVLAAVSQVYGWGLLLFWWMQKGNAFNNGLHVVARRVMLLSGIACSIKLLLQLGSTIPSLSTLAFGFRPIVIGYLHLVLLAVITLFLLAYLLQQGILSSGRTSIIGLVIFTIGVFINEALLMVQGVGDILYHVVPGVNEALLGTAVILFSGMLLVVLGQRSLPKGMSHHA